MGINQNTAQHGLQIYNSNITETQKNNKPMKFTLVNLQEKINSTIEKLEEMAQDTSKISYSAKGALKALQEARYMYLQETYNDSLTPSEEALVNEESNPTTKFKIAKAVYDSISQYNWIDPINELKTWLDEIYAANPVPFRIVESVANLKSTSNPLHKKLKKELLNSLNSENINESFKTIARSNPWSIECKQILNEMEAAEMKSISQEDAVVNKVISPVITESNGMYFHLNGKNYFGNLKTKIEEAEVTDSRYNNILDCLSFGSIKEDVITFYGQKNNLFKINLTEGKAFLNTIDVTDLKINELRNKLINSRLYHISESNKIDKLCMFVESFDMLVEMDNFLNVSSTKFKDLYLTMIAVEEGVWINKVNYGMNLNEMKFYTSAEEALNESINFIGYDASSYLSEKLIIEGNRKEIIKKDREKINSIISELEETKERIEEEIEKRGDMPELQEALKIVNTELLDKEKKLQETYTVSEKLNKKISQSDIDNFADDGYIEGTLKKTIDKNFKKGQTIMVNAEEFASFGAGDLLKIINPDNRHQKLVDKKDLKVDL